MQIVDANVLLYAVNRDSPHHRSARRWLDNALSGADAVGFSWMVVLAFLRLTTHPRVFPQALSLDQAVDVVEQWLAQPATMIIEPTPRHLNLLAALLADAGVAANHVNDAHLAALALEHRAQLVSFDRDFHRYEGLRHHVPK
ncbi:MAG: type II toxin-antitoxin system VapC family toxin [Nocardioidaceae bacterium]